MVDHHLGDLKLHENIQILNDFKEWHEENSIQIVKHSQLNDSKKIIHFIQLLNFNIKLLRSKEIMILNIEVQRFICFKSNAFPSEIVKFNHESLTFSLNEVKVSLSEFLEKNSFLNSPSLLSMIPPPSSSLCRKSLDGFDMVNGYFCTVVLDISKSYVIENFFGSSRGPAFK